MTPDIEQILEKLRTGQPINSHNLAMTHANVDGQPVIFCTDMERDPIQRHNRRGVFYEGKELNSLKKIFPEGGTFLDIGANIGNHSMFAAMFLKAGRVVPIEPNPLAYNLLIQNVLVNRLEGVVDLSRLGVGLSDKEAGGFAMEKRDRNLGSARMLSGEGSLQVFRGDTLFADEYPDLIKIDVEGMEMAVLAGLEGVLSKHRPAMLVEVDNENEAAFREWVKEVGYDVVDTVQRYRQNKNHLLAPKTEADGRDATGAETPEVSGDSEAA